MGITWLFRFFADYGVQGLRDVLGPIRSVIVIGAIVALQACGGTSSSVEFASPIRTVVGSWNFSAMLSITSTNIVVHLTSNEKCVDVAKSLKQFACGPAVPEPNRVVTVRLRMGQWRASAITDAQGIAHISAKELSESDFPKIVPHGEFDSIGLLVSFGRTTMSVELSSSNLSQLFAALVEFSQSRIARERSAKASAECDAGVSAARLAQEQDLLTAPDDVVVKWTAAQVSCGSLWNAELAKESSSAAELAREANVSLYFRAFDASLAAALTTTAVSVADFQRARMILDKIALVASASSVDERSKRLEQTRRKASELLVKTSRRLSSEAQYDQALAALDDAQTLGAVDRDTELLRAKVKSKWEAKKLREERLEAARLAKDERRAAREAELKEGPEWLFQYVCDTGMGPNVLSEVVKRGRNPRDVQRRLCENLHESQRYQCMHPTGTAARYCRAVITRLQ